MAHRYAFQTLQSLNLRGVRWKPARIYHVNATAPCAISETDNGEAKNAKDFIQNISGLMSND